MYTKGTEKLSLNFEKDGRAIYNREAKLGDLEGLWNGVLHM